MKTAKPTPAPAASVTVPRNNGLLMAVASVVLFAGSILAIKAIHLRYGSSVWMITMPRFGLGLIIALCLFRGAQSVQWRQLALDPWLVGRGVIGGAGVLLYNACVVEIGAARASLVTSAYPIFAAILAPLFLPEPLRWRPLAWVAVAFFGVALVVGIAPDAAAPSAWDWIALAVAGFSGFVVVSIRKLHARSNTATIFASQCVYGLLFCAPGAWATVDSVQPAEFLWLLVPAVSVALGQLLLTQSFKTLSATKGSALQLLGPPSVALGAFALFGERLALSEAIGAAVVLAACFQIANSRD